MRRQTAFMAILLTGFGLCGCAGTGGGAQGDSAASSFPIKPLKTGSFTSAGRYVLSEQEKAQDCKRIRGKMGVRIVQLQRTGIVRDSSTLSRKFGGFFGSPQQSRNAASNRKRDRAVLVAYNKLLADKNCQTVDLDQELAKPTPKTEQGRKPVKPQTR